MVCATAEWKSQPPGAGPAREGLAIHEHEGRAADGLAFVADGGPHVRDGVALAERVAVLVVLVVGTRSRSSRGLTRPPRSVGHGVLDFAVTRASASSYWSTSFTLTLGIIGGASA